MIVVADASAIVEYLLRTSAADPICIVIEAESTDLHVPSLCDVEVCSAVRRAVLDRRMTDTRGRETLGIYADLPLMQHGHTALLTRMYALRSDFSSHDAAYVALAELLGAPLLTADKRLARSVGRHTAVELATAFTRPR